MLRVVGAGFGRTGTLSLKAALERLLDGRCYHMAEVFAHRDHAPAWSAAVAGDVSALGPVLEPYVATVDWPACTLWSPLAAANPDALVLLSTRPVDRWWSSYEATIHALMSMSAGVSPSDLPPDARSVIDMTQAVMVEGSFGVVDYSTLDRDAIVAAYEAHNAAVRASAPPDRFLDFDVAQGWEPLCAALGAAVPDEPFPNVNDREQFWQTFGAGVTPS